MRKTTSFVFPLALLATAAMAIVGCKGDKGAVGPAGSNTGTISGTLTYKPGGTSYPATNVTVSVIPDVGAVATSAADGTYSITVPLGVYSVVFQGNAFATKRVDGVSVVAGVTYGLDEVLTATNPLVVTSAVSANAAGFNQQVTLGVNVSGGSAPYAYSWALQSPDNNPTAVSLQNPTSAGPSFTTGTLAAIAAGIKTAKFSLPSTPGFIGISTTQKQYMTYTFNCTVTDSIGFSKTVTVAVSPVTLAQATSDGNATFTGPVVKTVPGVVPVGRMVIYNLPGNSAALSLAFVPTQTGTTSSATLQDASTANPWFIPDAAGSFSIMNGATTVATVRAGTYTGASRSCGVCHTSAIQALVNAKFDEWANSAHGNYYFGATVPAGIDQTVPNALTIFAQGADGAVFGNAYGPACYGCHTVGYDATPSANNHGFDDIARIGPLSIAGQSVTPPWTLGDHSTIDYGRYKNTVPDELKALSGIQCENCHGPLSEHQANPAAIKPKPEYAATVCNVCHDALTHHDKGWMWQQSKHSDRSLAILEATVENRGTFAAHCGRCHSAQGFAAWLDQQQAGSCDLVNGAVPATCLITNGGAAATVAYLQSLDMTVARIQPQTCQACHDPHTTTLRVFDNTRSLPAGFSVTGAGAGAICMMCHNSRNGPHNDTAPALASFTAPHAADQSDVYMGQNAYFVPAYSVSPHTAVADTCVGCHVALLPASLTSTSANPNHTFHVDTTICVKCHGTGGGSVDGAALQAAVRQGIQDVDATAGADIVKQLGTLTTAGAGGALSAVLFNADPAHDESTAAPVALPVPTAVAFYEIHGQIGLVMTLPSPISVTYPSGTRTDSIVYAQVGNLKFTPTGGAAQNAFEIVSTKAGYDARNVTLVKALWNRFLIHGKSGDSAANALPPGDDEGANASAIHNPGFVQAVLGATKTQLTGLF